MFWIIFLLLIRSNSSSAPYHSRPFIIWSHSLIQLSLPLFTHSTNNFAWHLLWGRHCCRYWRWKVRTMHQVPALGVHILWVFPVQLNCGFPSPCLSSCHGKLCQSTRWLRFSASFSCSPLGDLSPCPISSQTCKFPIIKAVFEIQLIHEPSFISI